MQPFTDFIGHDLADALDIATEAQAVLLNVHIPKFRNELVEYGLCFS